MRRSSVVWPRYAPSGANVKQQRFVDYGSSLERQKELGQSDVSRRTISFPKPIKRLCCKISSQSPMVLWRKAFMSLLQAAAPYHAPGFRTSERVVVARTLLLSGRSFEWRAHLVTHATITAPTISCTYTVDGEQQPLSLNRRTCLSFPIIVVMSIFAP